MGLQNEIKIIKFIIINKWAKKREKTIIMRIQMNRIHFGNEYMYIYYGE